MVTSLDKHYADELKKLRKSHQLKQDAMAKLLKLESQQQYSYLENGKKHFTDQLILNICAIFQMSVTQFVQKPIDTTVMGHLLSEEDRFIIEQATDLEVRSVMYKKLFLESKIENTEAKLNALYKDYNLLDVQPGMHKVHVIF